MSQGSMIWPGLGIVLSFSNNKRAAQVAALVKQKKSTTENTGLCASEFLNLSARGLVRPECNRLTSLRVGGHLIGRETRRGKGL